jgi:hypothetical protein
MMRLQERPTCKQVMHVGRGDRVNPIATKVGHKLRVTSANGRVILKYSRRARASRCRRANG